MANIQNFGSANLGFKAPPSKKMSKTAVNAINAATQNKYTGIMRKAFFFMKSAAPSALARLSGSKKPLTAPNTMTNMSQNQTISSHSGTRGYIARCLPAIKKAAIPRRTSMPRLRSRTAASMPLPDGFFSISMADPPSPPTRRTRARREPSLPLSPRRRSRPPRAPRRTACGAAA